eukprot:351938-Chlamydomonas_euryale.AAC.2
MHACVHAWHMHDAPKEHACRKLPSSENAKGIIVHTTALSGWPGGWVHAAAHAWWTGPLVRTCGAPRRKLLFNSAALRGNPHGAPAGSSAARESPSSWPSTTSWAESASPASGWVRHCRGGVSGTCWVIFGRVCCLVRCVLCQAPSRRARGVGRERAHLGSGLGSGVRVYRE